MSGTGPFGLPRWALALLPIVLLGIVVGLFVVTTPLAGLDDGEPVPDVTISHATIPDEETFVLYVTNNGPEEVTISQVLVDEAYWTFEVRGVGDDRTLAPRESARVVIPYHWQRGWDYEIDLLLAEGDTVGHEIEAAVLTRGFDLSILWALALVGIFVGVIPVALGMLWFPYIGTMSERWLYAVLLFAAGVLAFLAFDAIFAAFEVAEAIPGAFEGELLIVLGVLGALLVVQSISSWQDGRSRARSSSGLQVAYLIALAIGLHNLAEGLAIGSAFSLGRTSLGAFLVIGFMLHNVTEGPAIVAPLSDGTRPALGHFASLGLLAGVPVIVGGWIGGLAFSPVIGAFFLAIGVGAILQVNWEIAGLVTDRGGRLASPTNLIAFLVGFGVMYLTDLLIIL